MNPHVWLGIQRSGRCLDDPICRSGTLALAVGPTPKGQPLYPDTPEPRAQRGSRTLNLPLLKRSPLPVGLSELETGGYPRLAPHEGPPPPVDHPGGCNRGYLPRGGSGQYPRQDSNLYFPLLRRVPLPVGLRGRNGQHESEQPHSHQREKVPTVVRTGGLEPPLLVPETSASANWATSACRGESPRPVLPTGYRDPLRQVEPVASRTEGNRTLLHLRVTQGFSPENDDPSGLRAVKDGEVRLSGGLALTTPSFTGANPGSYSGPPLLSPRHTDQSGRQESNLRRSYDLQLPKLAPCH